MTVVDDGEVVTIGWSLLPRFPSPALLLDNGNSSEQVRSRRLGKSQIAHEIAHRPVGVAHRPVGVGVGTKKGGEEAVLRIVRDLEDVVAGQLDGWCERLGESLGEWLSERDAAQISTRSAGLRRHRRISWLRLRLRLRLPWLRLRI